MAGGPTAWVRLVAPARPRPRDVKETANGHTLATRLARDHGRVLALVADALGHADVKTHAPLRPLGARDRRRA